MRLYDCLSFQSWWNRPSVLSSLLGFPSLLSPSLHSLPGVHYLFSSTLSPLSLPLETMEKEIAALPEDVAPVFEFQLSAGGVSIT